MQLQWIDLLHDKSVTTAERMRVLLSVYFMPEHKASCLQCAEKYGSHPNTYNAGNTAFGKAVIKKLGTFAIMEDGKQRYWYVAMGKGCNIKVNGNKQFEWQMRKALVEAIAALLMEHAIEKYLCDLGNHWKEGKDTRDVVQERVCDEDLVASEYQEKVDT